MKRISRPEKISIILIFVFALLAGLGVIKALGSAKGGFLAPTITYDDSLTADEKTYLEQLVNDHSLPASATISAETLPARSDKNTDFTYDIRSEEHTSELQSRI